VQNRMGLFILINLAFQTSSAQEYKTHKYTEEECLQAAFTNNKLLTIVDLEKDFALKQKGLAYDIPKTAFMYTQGQFNSIYPFDNIYGISQSIPSPGLLSAQSGLSKTKIKAAELKHNSIKAEIRKSVSETYYTIQHLMREKAVLHILDSIYELFLDMEISQHSTGKKWNSLEDAATRTEAHYIQVSFNEIERDLTEHKLKLQWLMQSEEVPEIDQMIPSDGILILDSVTYNVYDQPELLFLKEQIEVSVKEKKVEKQKLGPDFILGYFNQSIYGPANIYGEDYFLTRSNRLQGFQLGFSLPLFFTPYQSRIASGRVRESIQKEHYEYRAKEMSAGLKIALNAYRVNQNNLVYYRDNVLKDSRLMAIKSLEAYTNKEINYIEYLEILTRAYEMERNYMRVILNNNMAVIQINYYLNKE
jgi:heavy metal efflux system protein